MGNVNPRLRAQVAENQLAKYGYFHGKVNYEILTQKILRRPSWLIMCLWVR